MDDAVFRDRAISDPSIGSACIGYAICYVERESPMHLAIEQWIAMLLIDGVESD